MTICWPQTDSRLGKLQSSTGVKKATGNQTQYLQASNCYTVKPVSLWTFVQFVRFNNNNKLSITRNSASRTRSRRWQRIRIFWLRRWSFTRRSATNRTRISIWSSWNLRSSIESQYELVTITIIWTIYLFKVFMFSLRSLGYVRSLLIKNK